MAEENRKHHPKAIGDRTQAHVLARLVEHGRLVLVPWGENQRYDLVIDDGDRFVRVQCKTGRLSRGAVEFHTCSFTYHHPSNQGTKHYYHDYRGQADIFGVYCPQTGGVYLVPVEDVGRKSCRLRIDPPGNGQVKNVRWATDYELLPLPPE
jgi:hypothetical protein